MRIGRGIGSGKGKTGGRGVKGQKARTGVSDQGLRRRADAAASAFAEARLHPAASRRTITRSISAASRRRSTPASWHARAPVDDRGSGRRRRVLETARWRKNSRHGRDQRQADFRSGGGVEIGDRRDREGGRIGPRPRRNRGGGLSCRSRDASVARMPPVHHIGPIRYCLRRSVIGISAVCGRIWCIGLLRNR